MGIIVFQNLVELLVMDLVSLKNLLHVHHYCDIQNRSSATNIYQTKFYPFNCDDCREVEKDLTWGWDGII